MVVIASVKKKFFYASLCVLLVCTSLTVVSQQVYDTLIPIYAWEYNSNFTHRTQQEIDTLHYSFFEYQPNAKLSHYQLDLSSFASPLFSLRFEPLQQHTFYLQPYSESFLNAASLPRYTASRPYTDVMYSVAKNQEQQVKFFHTQNYSKDMNLGFIVQYYKSLGEYKPQMITGRHIAPWYSYTGPRFSSHFAYTYNSILRDVNGGLLQDTIPQYSRVFVTKTNSAQAQIISQDALFMQKWNLKPALFIQDSMSMQMPEYPLAVGYRLDYASSKYMFTDKNVQEDIYHTILWDSLSTNDTIRHKVIENSLFFELKHTWNASEMLAVLRTGYEYEFVGFRNYNFTNPEIHGNSLFYDGSIDFSFANNLALSHNHRYYYYGDSQQDFSMSTSVDKTIDLSKNNEILLRAEYEYELAQPHCMFSYAMTNHYFWDIETTPQQSNHLFAEIESSFGNVKLGMHYYHLQDYMYFDEFGTSKQYDGSSSALVYEFKKTTTLLNFEMQNSCVFQNSAIQGINIPNWATYNAISYRNVVYKKLIHFALGVEGIYYPKFFVPQYSIAMGTFTPQYASKYGAFPHLNAFVSFKYKPIRFMLKYNGLYTQLTEKNFTALNYPQQSGYVTFAVSWLFYN